MVQHLMLMIVAPPLVWLAAPLFPMLRGLPREIRRYWIAPLLRWPPFVRFGVFVTHPVTAWLIFVAANWLWHLPSTYELALRNSNWHHVQHICFLAAGLVFWYPVVRPFPARPRWSTWWLAPYLILADIQNTLLAAWLTFSGPGVVPLLRSDAALRPAIAARRSIRRRRHHVGARIARVPRAASLARCANAARAQSRKFLRQVQSDGKSKLALRSALRPFKLTS